MTYDEIIKNARRVFLRRTIFISLCVFGVALCLSFTIWKIGESIGETMLSPFILMSYLSTGEYVPSPPSYEIFATLFGIFMFFGIFVVYVFARTIHGSSVELFIWFMRREITYRVALHLNKQKQLRHKIRYDISRVKNKLKKRQKIEKALIEIADSPATSALWGTAHNEVAATTAALQTLEIQLVHRRELFQELLSLEVRWIQLIEAQREKLAFLNQTPTHFDVTALKNEIADQLRPLFDHWVWKEEPCDTAVVVIKTV